MKTSNLNEIALLLLTTNDESPDSPTAVRLDSWKEIANYFNRSVRTVQRWEMKEFMPVHRHCHGTGGSVYAYVEEVDAWLAARSVLPVSETPQMPATSLMRATEPAVLRLLEIIVEHLNQEAAPTRAALPAADALRQRAAKEDLTVADHYSAPALAERATLDGTIGMPLFVACRKLRVDQ